ncbi:MAG: FAD-binding protein [Rhodobacteraceae bacterium]|nr:FAD-binding protein [Paracoccaceae bacterium]
MPDNAAAIAEIKALLGERLSTGHSVRELHARDAAHTPPALPDAVAFPETTKEVSQVVEICHRHGCPVVPYGVGTSLEGHIVAFRGGVTLDFSQMNKVLEVHGEDLNVVIQPGVTREQLNEELRATGLFFPIDPGANATLGGMAATRASGTTAVRYGTMKDNVLALEVVLADGRVIRTGTQARKSSAGYDLTRLMVGSEGTLGVITELTLILHGQPEAVSAAVCEFPDTQSAVNAVIMAVQIGLPMARIEYVDTPSIIAISNYSGLELSECPHLFLEFHGSETGVKEQAEQMAEIAAEFGGGGFKWSAKAEERSALWKARHESYFAVRAVRPGAVGITSDVCVPISKLAEAIEATMADAAEHGIYAPILGHVGDGNYHTLLLVEEGNTEEWEAAQGLIHRMNMKALELGGTVSGEHGIGAGKMKYMAAEHGDAWSVMADIKRALDPENILNPGKMVQVN